MATVTKVSSDTYRVVLTPKEQRAMERLAQEPPAVAPEKRMEGYLGEWLAQAQKDYLNADWPAKQPKYDALPIPKQAQIDNILNGG